MSESATAASPELRLALAMRGGVSLAVWIGGACAEIDSLRWASDGEPVEGGSDEFLREVLACSPYSRVVVDVMAGASAGGLNGVLFAAAIRHGFRMDSMLEIWREVAQVDVLMRSDEPWISLFDGDKNFLDVIRDRLEERIASGDAEMAEKQQTGGYIDLQLSATLVEPIDQPAVSPGDEHLRSTRSTARFHFRHDPGSVRPRRDFEIGDVARMAIASRATASFPFAFEAAVVRSSRSERFDLSGAPAPRNSDESSRLTDCRGVFSEHRGGERTDQPFCEDDFVVADGGIVDNIPLGKALDAIRDAPAGGLTGRVLLYLHPTGPSVTRGGRLAVTGDAVTSTTKDQMLERRGPVAVARGLVAARLQGESIDGDLEQMEAHNRLLRLRRLLRRDAGVDLGAADPVDFASARVHSYLTQRAAADSELVCQLLRNPLATLGEDPFPISPGGDSDDRWRAPVARWSRSQRLAITGDLWDLFGGRLSTRLDGEPGSDTLLESLLVAGLGPLSRSVALLLELVQEGGRAGLGLASWKLRLYRLAGFVGELERIRQIGWVAAAGNIGPDDEARSWAEATLDELNALLELPPSEAESLMAAVVAGRSEPLSDYFDRSSRGLQRIADGSALAAAHGDTDVRELVVAELEHIANAIRSERKAVAVLSGTELIRRVLLVGPGSTRARLGALEVLLVREHLEGPAKGAEISFARISAAAPTIDAERYTLLHGASRALRGDSSQGGPHDFLAPDVKLAGNELASFSAFLDERWRVNDWTWGRMDAVPTLVDLLLGTGRPDVRLGPGQLSRLAELAGSESEDLDEVRRGLIRRRQDWIVAKTAEQSSGLLPEDPAEWTAGIETLAAPGSSALARSMGDTGDVAARVLGGLLPPSVRRITPVLRVVVRRVAASFAHPRRWPRLPGTSKERRVGGGDGSRSPG